jgi:hypothetical protein
MIAKRYSNQIRYSDRRLWRTCAQVWLYTLHSPPPLQPNLPPAHQYPAVHINRSPRNFKSISFWKLDIYVLLDAWASFGCFVVSYEEIAFRMFLELSIAWLYSAHNVKKSLSTILAAIRRIFWHFWNVFVELIWKQGDSMGG